NQNGVAYPGWAGDRTGALNDRLRAVLRAADHVVYQSEFCKQSADAVLGEPGAPWEVLRNPVDTTEFTPADAPPDGGPFLLLGGDQSQTYRLETALRTLVHVPDATLLVA